MSSGRPICLGHRTVDAVIWVQIPARTLFLFFCKTVELSRNFLYFFILRGGKKKECSGWDLNPDDRIHSAMS